MGHTTLGQHVLIRYTFDITGSLRVADHWPMEWRGFTFEFVVNSDRVVKQLRVSTREQDRSLWPTIEPRSDGPVKAHINIPSSPKFETLKIHLGVMQGLIGMYCPIEIEINRPRMEWIAEDDEEKNLLTFYAMEPAGRGPGMAFPFDILARSIFCTDAGRAFEVPLSFYRRGYIQSKNGQHVDAFYNFFLFIETSFGGGNFRKAALVNAFMSSKELVGSVVKSRQLFLRANVLKRYPGNLFVRFLRNESQPSKILEKIVDHRGFLHHHSNKRRQNWHPENQREFAAEEEFLQYICYHIGIERVVDVMFSTKTTDDFLLACQKGEWMLHLQVEYKFAIQGGKTITRKKTMDHPGTRINRHLVWEVLSRLLESSEELFPDAEVIELTLRTGDGREILGFLKNFAP